jgi:COMPASS component BRE2
MPPFGTGDVIGLHISLPPSSSAEPDADSISPQRGVFRDRIPIRFRGQLYFEQPDYTASKEMEDLLTPVLPPATQLNPSIPAPKPTLPVLEGSFIDVYKNGELQGRAFEDLLAFLPPSSQLGGKDLDDGALGYYPVMSVFRYGIVRVNFGPDFEAFPRELEGRGVRGMWERYEEMLREEKEWDLLDEMEWEKEARERQASAGGVETVPAAGAEIKELADDEWT